MRRENRMRRTGMVASLAAAGCIAVSTGQSTWGESVDQSIARYLEEPVAQEKAPAMWAAIIGKNGIEAIAATGVRKRGSPEKATIDDQVHIGSMTKAMTSVLLARLIGDGTFENGWNTTIAEVYPELERKMHESYREITLDELVRHRSGLAANPVNWWSYRNRDIKKRRYRHVKRSLRKRPAVQRGEFLYSNLSYMVAGAMAERVTDKSWEELIREELFEPLGMHRTGFGVPGTRGEVDEAWGHRRGENGKWKGIQHDNEPSLGPAGTVHLTLADYAKFARIWFKDVKPEIVTRAQIEELATARTGDYAAGWFSVHRDWGRGKVLTHSGTNTYWRMLVWLAPKTGKAYVAVANADNEEMHRILDGIIWKLINHVR